MTFERSSAGSRGGTGHSGVTSLGSDTERERGDTPGERKRAQIQTRHTGKWRHFKTTPGTKDAFLVVSFPENQGGSLVQTLPGHQTDL